MFRGLFLFFILFAQVSSSPSSTCRIVAVHFEQALYDECIETCEKAVDVGRENRADYKLMAK